MTSPILGEFLGGTTGYAINPARDLGPRIAHAILSVAGKGSSDWAYASIPVVGPTAEPRREFTKLSAIGLPRVANRTHSYG